MFVNVIPKVTFRTGNRCSCLLLNEATEEDGYFLQYFKTTPEGKPVQEQSRWSKNNRPPANELRLVYVFLDYDTPNHEEWPNQDLLLETCKAISSIRPEPTIVYSTPRGIRLGYFLENPIPISNSLDLAGLSWPKLPNVVLDEGKLTWQSLFKAPAQNAFIRYYDGPKLQALPRKQRISPSTNSTSFDLDFDEQYARELVLNDPMDPTSGFTKLGKRIHKAIQKADPVIASKLEPPFQVLAKKGERHKTTLRLANLFLHHVKKPLFHKTDHRDSIHACAGLVIYPLSLLGDDESFIDQFLRIFTNDLNKPTPKQESHESLLEHTPYPHLSLQDHLSAAILTKGNSCYCMRPDGSYDTTPVSPSKLHPRLKLIGTDKLLQTHKPSPTGLARKTSQELIDDYSQEINEIILVPQIPCARVLPHPSENLNRPVSLEVPIFRRNHIPDDISQQNFTQQKEWLKLFAGPENLSRIKHWIAHSLAIDEGPTSSIIIIGEPSIGKNLFVQALTDCFVPNSHGTDTAFSSFHEDLLKPLIVIDEGITIKSPKISERLRQLTSGTDLQINQKFLPPQTLRTFPRIIFTANNTRILDDIFSHSSITPADARALALRFSYIDTRPRTDAAEFLESLGGRKTTQSWVGPNGKLTQYFQYLYSIRSRLTLQGPAPSNRYLTPGNLPLEIIRTKLLTNKDAYPVLKLIAKIAANPPPSINAKITSTEILITIDTLMSASPLGNLLPRSVENVLTTLSKPGSPSRNGIYSLDRTLLADVCERLGITTELSSLAPNERSIFL